MINNTLAGGADVVNNSTMFISDHNKIELLINNNVCYTDGSNSVFSATGNALALVAPKKVGLTISPKRAATICGIVERPIRRSKSARRWTLHPH